MKIVIIGAGPAGVSAAETLRTADPAVKITMVSREPYPPYSPPVLATYFLQDDETIFWKGKDFAAQHKIEYLAPKNVVRIDPDKKIIQFDDKSETSYDRLILATGSTLYAPIKVSLTQPSASPDASFYNFKSMTAALKIKESIRRGEARSAVIVGAGFIGTELAIVLRELGLEVTQVEKESRVMPRLLDEDSAEIVQQILEERGIKILLNAKGTEFFGKTMAEGLTLDNGEKLFGDLMIAATGVKPNVDFLKKSGFEVNWGLLVDDNLQTNFPDIYAAGDCAEVKDLLTGERFVHAIYINAREQGQIAARNALGEKVVYEGAHNMNSLKHLGISLIALGTRDKQEELVYSNGKDVLKKLYLNNGCLTGARLVGDIKNAGIYFTLMNRKVNVTSFKNLLLRKEFNMGYLIQNGLYPAGLMQNVV